MNKEEQINYLNKYCPFKFGPHSKRRVRQNFFESIDTEIQAYLLGFHTADGCCNPDKGTVRFSLQERDSEIIYLYKDFISPDARIFVPQKRKLFDKKTGGVYDRKDLFGIDIYSKPICDSLTKHGVGKNKTYLQINIPKMNDDLIRHFIRGYFDGDGCLTWTVLGQNTSRPNLIRGHVFFTSKTETLLKDIQEYFLKNGILCNILHEVKKEVYSLRVSRGQLPKLFKLFYEDSNFYLKRKYEKFNHFVNTEATQLIAEYRNAQEVNVIDSNNPPTSVEHPNGMKMCAELTGNCENSEIKSSEDNNMGMEWNDSSECC